MQVTAIVYHAHCLDGLCAAAIAKIEFPHARCIAASYSTPIPQFEDGDGVLMVDFCYPPETLKQVADHAQLMTRQLNEKAGLPLKIVLKPTGTTLDEISAIARDANHSSACVGVTLHVPSGCTVVVNR